MHLMPSTSGLIHYLVILRVCQNTKHHTNSKQRRNANSKGSTKKQQNVRNSNIRHHMLAFPPFSSRVNHMVNAARPKPAHARLSVISSCWARPSLWKPRGPSAGGANRYSQSGNPSGGYNHPNRANQGAGGGYGNAPYPQQGRGPPYGSSGPRGGASGYGGGAPNYQQAVLMVVLVVVGVRT
ncbi:Cyclin-dependent kinase C-2 [Bienertia sinuspersici]